MSKSLVGAMVVSMVFTVPALGQGNGNGNGNGPNFGGGNQSQNQGQGQMQHQGQVQGQAQGQQQNAFGGAGGAGGAAGAGGVGNGGTGNGGAGGTSQGGTGGNANNSGVNVNNSTSTNYPSGPGAFPAASAYAPSFALGSACQEAFSLGGSMFFFGISGGRAYTLDFCKAMMKADYWRKNGRDDMARASECKFTEFRSLYKETGTPCREDFTKEQFAAERAAPGDSGTSRVVSPARKGYIGPNGYVPYPAGYVAD